MRKMTVIMAVVFASGCATSTQIGNLQNDCDPGFLSPSVCLVTAKVDGKETVQTPVTGPGALNTLAPVAATIGGAYFIGEGLSNSGSKVSTTTTTNNSANGGKATGGSSSSQGGAGGSSSSNGGDAVAFGGQGGKGGRSDSSSGAISLSGSSANAGANAGASASNHNNNVNGNTNSNSNVDNNQSAPSHEEHDR